MYLALGEAELVATFQHTWWCLELLGRTLQGAPEQEPCCGSVAQRLPEGCSLGIRAAHAEGSQTTNRCICS